MLQPKLKTQAYTHTSKQDIVVEPPLLPLNMLDKEEVHNRKVEQPERAPLVIKASSGVEVTITTHGALSIVGTSKCACTKQG